MIRVLVVMFAFHLSTSCWNFSSEFKLQLGLLPNPPLPSLAA